MSAFSPPYGNSVEGHTMMRMKDEGVSGFRSLDGSAAGTSLWNDSYDVGDPQSTLDSPNNQWRDDEETDEIDDEEEEEESPLGEFVKHIIYGALDGIVAMLAIVSGGAGGQLDVSNILILGLSNLIADALSMGLCDALIAISHQEYVESQYQKETRNFRDNKLAEVEVLTNLFAAKGLQRHRAKSVVDTMSKYPKLFISILMLEKLHLNMPEENEAPWTDGFITFCSFSVFGLIPLLLYCVVPQLFHPVIAAQHMFHITAIATLVLLFMLGVATSKFSGKFWLWCGCEFLFMGGAVAFTAYFIGHSVRVLLQAHSGYYFSDLA